MRYWEHLIEHYLGVLGALGILDGILDGALGILDRVLDRVLLRSTKST